MTSAGACLRGIAWGPSVDTEGGGEDDGDVELPVWSAAGFVPLVAELAAMFTSASAVREYSGNTITINNQSNTIYWNSAHK